jgi:hypothetical protein
MTHVAGNPRHRSRARSWTMPVIGALVAAGAVFATGYAAGYGMHAASVSRPAAVQQHTARHGAPHAQAPKLSAAPVQHAPKLAVSLVHLWHVFHVRHLAHDHAWHVRHLVHVRALVERLE